MRALTVGTRGSALALRQTNWVVGKLREGHPDLEVEVSIIKTRGDKILDVPLAKIGDKGLFVKEIEAALLSGDIDLAVHSMKDLPTEMPEGLTLAAVPERVDPSDVLVSAGLGLQDLPANVRIGSSSLRRRAQLQAHRPDLRITDIRGNLDTRLRKLDDGEFDSIILAWAGLYRMGWAERVTEKLSWDVCLPAVGQGALAIQARADDAEILGLLRALDHPQTRTAVTAERSLLRALGGGCQVPIGALGTIEGGVLRLRGVVADVNGTRLVRAEVSGDTEDAEVLGRELADRLVAGGGDQILDRLHEE